MIRTRDPRIVRTQIGPQRNHMREQLASRMYLPLLVLLCADGFEPSDPRITAWYESDYSEYVCGNRAPDKLLILLFFWCAKRIRTPDPRITNPQVFLAVPTNQYLTNGQRGFDRLNKG